MATTQSSCTLSIAMPSSLHRRHHHAPLASCIPLHPRHKSLLGASSSPPLRDLCSRPSSRVAAWFKFGTDAEKAGIYGSQGRDDFDRDDVEQYFNYMGMLATEGTYDKMEALLNEGIHPVDILLLLAASEGDKPKIQELMKAGARFDVADVEGRTALERAQDDDVREFILSLSK